MAELEDRLSNFNIRLQKGNPRNQQKQDPTHNLLILKVSWFETQIISNQVCNLLWKCRSLDKICELRTTGNQVISMYRYLIIARSLISHLIQDGGYCHVFYNDVLIATLFSLNYRLC